MAYHITLIANNSKSSVAITNPAATRDAKLVGPSTQYSPERPILVNKIDGNPNYLQAIDTAVNIYTNKDNYCFWDNTNSAVNGMGQSTGAIAPYNASAGDLQIVVNADGTLTFSRVGAAAAESA